MLTVFWVWFWLSVMGGVAACVSLFLMADGNKGKEKTAKYRLAAVACLFFPFAYYLLFKWLRETYKVAFPKTVKEKEKEEAPNKPEPLLCVECKSTGPFR